MSRVGKHPVELPAGVTAKAQGQVVSISGKMGSVDYIVHPLVDVSVEANKIVLNPRDNSQQARMNWGTARNSLDNVVKGVHQGFTHTLDINGVGYRVAVEGEKLVMQLGYSHPVHYAPNEGIDVAYEKVKVSCPKPTQIVINGASRQRVGQVAAEIRAFRGPEPYKGKGIKYEEETILRKEGKKK